MNKGMMVRHERDGKQQIGVVVGFHSATTVPVWFGPHKNVRLVDTKELTAVTPDGRLDELIDAQSLSSLKRELAQFSGGCYLNYSELRDFISTKILDLGDAFSACNCVMNIESIGPNIMSLNWHRNSYFDGTPCISHKFQMRILRENYDNKTMCEVIFDKPITMVYDPKLIVILAMNHTT